MALVLPVCVWAQFSISGTITAKASGSALPGASVTLDQTTAVAASASGTFSFKNLRAGKHLLKVNYTGFTAEERIVDLASDQVLAIVLTESRFLADEITVTSTRAGSQSATTYRNLNKEELAKNNLGQDLPYLLNQTPSVVVTSDAGAGVGYTGIRIRGSDPTRVNVTINGIPYNDTESQGSFFVDLPDFASSVDNIQVQRGVGTSTNGAGAFGGSINIQTTTRSDSAYAELNNTYGSFGTLKNTVSVGSGMLRNAFSFDGRLSNIQSDGYIDRASSKLKSYFLSGAWYGKNSLLRANVFSGNEKTYQAWNGIPEALLATNRRHNEFTYNDQTDNYRQDHYQLLFSHSFSPSWSINTALHYTKGKGYYEEFKTGQKFTSYTLQPVTIGGITYTKTDLIRRRWLDNDFYGTTWSINYQPKSPVALSLGGAYNYYDGRHFGEVIWTQYSGGNPYKHPYYEGTGKKSDVNVFGKATWTLDKVTLSGDLQFRHTGYALAGLDKNRYVLNQDAYLNFFNPKVGITYAATENSSWYASFAVANKEPNRDDYINSTLATRPKPEHLKDVEAGYRTAGSGYSFGLNGFAMIYRDQLISTGKINDVGEYIRQNVHDSYRLGAEFDGRIQLAPGLHWGATAALSRNRVKNYTSFDDDYDNGGQLSSTFKNSRLAFSPSFVGSSELSLAPVRHAEIAVLTKFVSRQFLDNTSNTARMIDPFFVNDLRLRYNFSTRAVKNIGLTLLVNNVLGEKYETNGYTFSYLYGGEYTTENFYFPQAGRNFLLSLGLKF